MVTPRTVTILGATGSVGQATLDLIDRAPAGAFRVVALTANANAAELAALATRFDAEFAAVADPAAGPALSDALAGTRVRAGSGDAAVLEAAAMDADWTMAAIVGAAGLRPTLEAVRRGGVVAFANKEALVCAGPLFMETARACGATLLPVDSEHNAIFQALDDSRPDDIRRVILTASGGPFRTAPRSAMAAATPEQALAHPTWTMGAKISIDSATMMNKGLEIIEACRLFDLPQTQVDVLVHPESIVHGLVEHVDGGLLAQLGSPDMRTPIAHALAWPGRIETPVARLDLVEIGRLTFEAPDPDRFPAIELARRAADADGCAPAVFNAANEVAVGAFLDRRIGFLDIPTVVSEALERALREGLDGAAPTDFEAVFDADRTGRVFARDSILRAAG